MVSCSELISVSHSVMQMHSLAPEELFQYVQYVHVSKALQKDLKCTWYWNEKNGVCAFIFLFSEL